MNFAVPALLIFLLVLPGIVFRFAYARGPNGWTSPASLRAVSDEIALGVVVALILHTAWLAIVLASPWPRHTVVYDDWLFVLLGSPARDSLPLSGVIGRASDQIGYISAYFLTLYLFSALSGLLAHFAVRRLRLDRRLKSLRFDNPWHYLLTGEIEEFRDRADSQVSPLILVRFAGQISQAASA